jgi:hypothetical protein
MQTTNYWKISPWDWGKDPQGWERQWRLCVKEKTIAMGWDKVGDLTNLSMEKIKTRLFRHYGEYRLPNYKARLTRDAKQLFSFKKIRNEDIVIANKGQSEIAGVGQVNGDYYFNRQASDFKHTLPVKWYSLERRKIKRQMHWLQTIIPLTRQEVQKLGILEIIKGIKTIQQYEVDIKRGAKFSQRVTRSREFQQAFRNAILEIYQTKCAACDVDDDAFLRGCHIVPVKDDPSIATDLRNGICLCVVHDVAFEKGIFCISDRYEICVSDSFKTKSRVLDSAISKLDGKKITLPNQHPPKKSYLEKHRIAHGFLNL